MGLFCLLLAWIAILPCFGKKSIQNSKNPVVTEAGNYSSYYNIPRPKTIEEAQYAVNCQEFMKPILERRDSCTKNNITEEVDICVYFASDYEFVVPFLVHHLALGARNIFIYNNDEKVAWYRHPAVLCMVAEQIVEIQPWFGEKVLMRALNNCYRHKIPQVRNNKADDMLVWGTNFDIDEMLVLHKHQCINEIVHDIKSPSLALNWAFFVP